MVQGAHPLAGRFEPAVLQVVLGRRVERSVQLYRPAHRGRPGDKVAFYWEGEPGDERVLTYQDLYDEVCRFANGLRSIGVKKGDRIAVYMGMVPELAIAMLACARIGAAHSVIFGGFSSDAIYGRVETQGLRCSSPATARGGAVVWST